MTRVGWARRRPPALCPHGVLPDACVECAKAPRDGVEQERDALLALNAKLGREVERLDAEVERLRDESRQRAAERDTLQRHLVAANARLEAAAPKPAAKRRRK